MRGSRLGVSAAMIALLAAGATGCVAAARQTSVADLAADSVQRAQAQYQREQRDSIAAERIAMDVGPRVTVSANFTSYSGSRRVESRFHMYDDAYVVVGQLGADGRLRIVFPQSPRDDGFVQGNRVYTVPSFFAGFTDEFRMRWAYDRYRTRDAQLDSYDGGIGYVFVIASWRPMRLDRISNGNAWEAYDVAEVSYMSDPREAIDELASLVAGDNPEAYTVEYAHYLNSNYGSLSLASLSRCPIGNGFYDAFSPTDYLGFANFGFMPFGAFSPYGYSYDPCGSSYGYGSQYAFGAFGYPYGIYRVGYVPPYRQPSLPTGTPGIGGRPQIGQRPGHASDSTGAIPTRAQPRSGNGTGTDATAAQYRRRGLIVQDAGPVPGHESSPRQWQGLGTMSGAEPARPSIQEMLSRRRDLQNERRATGDTRGTSMADESWSRTHSTSNPRGARSSGEDDGFQRSRPSARSGSSENSGRSTSGRASRPAYTPRGESPRSAPARSEPRSAPAAHSEPPRAEPASRPAASGSRRPSS